LPSIQFLLQGRAEEIWFFKPQLPSRYLLHGMN
jgi:hypothetical protein